MDQTTRRTVKGAALLCLVSAATIFLVRPAETLTTFLEWLPAIVILAVLGSIIRWDMRYERRQEKERGEQ